jgi:photosystem II stability/assembly factor-like uncharacterized protein
MMNWKIPPRFPAIRLAISILLIGCAALLAPFADRGAPAVASAQQAPALSSTIYIPLISKADPYADWVSLGQPAGGAAVNFLYASHNCNDVQPSVILAGTDAGLYSFGTTWTRNTGLSARIQVYHILGTSQGELYVASYNLGLWRSANGGSTWAPESVPNGDTTIYWLASTDQYLYAAGSKGLYRRASSGGNWSQIQVGIIYSVAVSGSNVYAAQIGKPKDTLLISGDGGNTWPIARQLPGSVNFVQTLDPNQGNAQILIGAINGGLFTLDGANNIVPFSQGISQTVYGIWRDSQERVYAALEQPGGLLRFAKAGGSRDLDLSALPNGGSLAAQTLYTVNGSTACNIVAVGSEQGNVWMRRLP